MRNRMERERIETGTNCLVCFRLLVLLLINLPQVQMMLLLGLLTLRRVSEKRGWEDEEGEDRINSW